MTRSTRGRIVSILTAFVLGITVCNVPCSAADVLAGTENTDSVGAENMDNDSSGELDHTEDVPSAEEQTMRDDSDSTDVGSQADEKGEDSIISDETQDVSSDSGVDTDTQETLTEDWTKAEAVSDSDQSRDEASAQNEDDTVQELQEAAEEPEVTIAESEEEEEEAEELQIVEEYQEAELLDDSGAYVVNFSANSGAYVSYTEYATGNSGYISGSVCADAAYLGTSGNDYIFMMSGVIGKVSKSQVDLVAVSAAKSLSYYYVSSGILYHRLTKNLTGTAYFANLNNGKAPSWLSTGVNYYSYDGHYFYTTYASMISDYVNDTRAHAVNPNTPYYNYYQFLPMRSSTVFSADDLNKTINSKITSTSKMKDIGGTLIENQYSYGVNALLMACVAIGESGWGSSNICKTKNNLFGLNAVDTSPGQSANYYSSVSACVKDFAETYMSKQYLNPKNWKYSGGYVGNKASGITVRYASDPYWGEKVANYAYYLEDSLSAKDSYRYTIAVKEPVAKLKSKPNSSVQIRNSASSSSTALYTAAGLFSVSFILKDGASAVSGYYRVQSDPVLNSGRTAINTASGEYIYANMYGYLPASSVAVVVQGSGASDIVQVKNGVCQAEDGNWYYYENGKINTQYTGVAQNSNGWWRIEKGKVNFNFKGFAQNSNGWWYLTGGKVQFNTNDVIQGTVNNKSGWWHVLGGKVTFTDTVAQNKNGWWYIKKGMVDFSYTGMAQNSNGWWYIKNGQVDFNYTGMAQNSYGWWRIEKGKVNFKYNGFAQNSYGWWYLTGGKVQFDTNDVIQGTVNNKSGWWHVLGGKVTFTDTVAQNKNGWWYIKNGQVDFNYTGMAQNSYGWWRIEKGKVNFEFDGFAQNSYGWWYLMGGKVRFDTNDVIQGTVNKKSGWWYVSGSKVTFTETVAKNQYGWWYIKNGMVDFSYTGVAQNSYGWWRIENGKVDFTFTGVAKNSNGLWYIKDGKVDFSYNGIVTSDGVTYQIIKGKAEKYDKSKKTGK